MGDNNEFVVGESALISSEMLTLPDDRSATGAVAVATAPTVTAASTNAPAKTESMFK